jgi:hypothetical protein
MPFPFESKGMSSTFSFEFHSLGTNLIGVKFNQMNFTFTPIGVCIRNKSKYSRPSLLKLKFKAS